MHPGKPLAICVLALTALMAACAHAQPEPVRFIVHTRDGPLPPAAIGKLDDRWLLALAGSESALAGSDWVSFQQEKRLRPAPLGQNFLLLGNGDRLPIKPGAPVRLQDGRVIFTPAGPLQPLQGTELSLFRPHVALMVLAVPEGVDDPERLIVALKQEPRDQDIVLLRNGDRIEGQVTGLGAEGCAVLADGRTLVTPWPKLAGVAFGTANLARPRPRKMHALAVLAGGARLHFGDLRFDELQKRWAGRTTTGFDAAIAEDGLITLDLLQGGAVYLSELTPVRYEHTPYLGVRWPIGVDTAVDGRPLRVAGETHDKGIGLHARSRVTYKLDGQYRWFECTVGLDPTMGAKARARMAVVVGDKEYLVGEGKEQTVENPPATLRLDVRAARELTLVVDFGSLGDVQARVNWGSARLLKGGN